MVTRISGRPDSTRQVFVFNTGYFSMKEAMVVYFGQKLKQEQPQSKTGCVYCLSLMPLLVSMVEVVTAFSDENRNKK